MMKNAILSTCLAVSLLLLIPSVQAMSGEQAQPGQEHPGRAAAGYSVREVKEVLLKYIQKVTQEGGGLFRMVDRDDGNHELTLRFVRLHEPRMIGDGRFFVCADFQVDRGDRNQLYDIDFWIAPQEGGLSVTEGKVHKEPLLEWGRWEKKPRYLFVNDRPVALQQKSLDWY